MVDERRRRRARRLGFEQRLEKLLVGEAAVQAVVVAFDVVADRRAGLLEGLELFALDAAQLEL
jgi:hypothetical protein